MIKSKIEARERALELAIAYYNGIEGNRMIKSVETAKKFESYLIGDAELPEVFDDNGHLKELFEVAQREIEKIRRANDYFQHDLEKSFVGKVREYNPEANLKNDVK